jgi:hypothetical protein
MPLFANAAQLIRANLEQFKPDVKIHVKAVAIGTLSDAQLACYKHGPKGTGAAAHRFRSSFRRMGTFLKVAFFAMDIPSPT